MSASLTAPDLRRAIGDLARRVGILERRITSTTTTATTTQEIVFSHAGEVAETVSPPIRVWQGGILTVLAVTFETAGSTDTVIDVLRNGITVATVTVPDSVEIYNGDVSARFVADVDTLALEVTSAGTGAENMTAAARFS